MVRKLKEWEKPVNQRTHKGYEVFSGSKSDEGLITNMVDWLIDAIDTVSYLHRRPVAFHVILDDPNFVKLSQLPQFLRRFVADKPESGFSNEVFYIITHEIRPRSKQSHSHLWVFMDNFTPRERHNIQYELVAQGYAKKAKVARRKRDLFPDDWQGNLWYHCVRIEPRDLILRASYLAKHATKNKAKRRRWSASQLPKIKSKPSVNTVKSLDLEEIWQEPLPLLGLATIPSYQEAVNNL